MNHKGAAIGLLTLNTLILGTLAICMVLPEYKQNHIEHPEAKYLILIAGVLLGGCWWVLGGCIGRNASKSKKW